MSKVALVFLATLGCVGALKGKGPAKTRAHVDTCLEANTHLFLGLNGENIQSQMSFVEEACDASQGCAMFKKSEVAFHRNAYIPQIAQLLENPHLKQYDFEVCLPQTSCLEEEFSSGAVVYAAQCRYNDETGQRLTAAINGGSGPKNVGQGCQCGLQQCIDQCVDADTNERETIGCAGSCQDQLTTMTQTFIGNFMCNEPTKGTWIGFKQAAIKMAQAQTEYVVNYMNAHNGKKPGDHVGYDMELVQTDPRSYFYDCEEADKRPTKMLAKTFGLPNLVGDAMHWLGLTNKY